MGKNKKESEMAVEPHISGSVIIGHNGCYCHPFSSWEECEKFHNQKFCEGDFVKHRHSGRIGSIYHIEKEKGFVIVEFGLLPRDRELEHVANLIGISYRESFGLELPPEGTEVKIDFMEGCNYSIIWPGCPDGENMLYSWLKSKIHAKAIIEKHKWINYR